MTLTCALGGVGHIRVRGTPHRSPSDSHPWLKGSHPSSPGEGGSLGFPWDIGLFKPAPGPQQEHQRQLEAPKGMNTRG